MPPDGAFEGCRVPESEFDNLILSGAFERACVDFFECSPIRAICLADEKESKHGSARAKSKRSSTTVRRGGATEERNE
jgi:hypothetical protein